MAAVTSVSVAKLLDLRMTRRSHKREIQTSVRRRGVRDERKIIIAILNAIFLNLLHLLGEI